MSLANIPAREDSFSSRAILENYSDMVRYEVDKENCDLNKYLARLLLLFHDVYLRQRHVIRRKIRKVNRLLRDSLELMDDSNIGIFAVEMGLDLFPNDELCWASVAAYVITFVNACVLYQPHLIPDLNIGLTWILDHHLESRESFVLDALEDPHIPNMCIDLRRFRKLLQNYLTNFS